jgi:hypothetical protein
LAVVPKPAASTSSLVGFRSVSVRPAAGRSGRGGRQEVDGVVDLQVDQPLSLDGAVVEYPGQLETDDPVDPCPDQDGGGGGAGGGVRPLLRVCPSFGP